MNTPNIYATPAAKVGKHEWRELPPGSFRESGTMVNVAMLTIERAA